MSLWNRLRGLNKGLLVASLAGSGLFITGLLLQPKDADAARNERTISLYEIHLKETTTVTFKRDGKFIPAALKKLNWAMRDWRTSVTTKMDPKLFDLIWELQQEVGSKGPVHVISGHRSAKTNRKLRRRGGGQAKKSQHVQGRAMDVHFPDVSMRKVRNSALVREKGGVGYYPTSALPFVHVDTARVRAWPRLGRRELAMLFPHGATKHRPSSGGPLNSRDRKKARVRLAVLARKSRTATLLANASIPRDQTPRAGRLGNVTIASLANNGYGTMEIPGVASPHTSRLWVNKPGNKALPSSIKAPTVVAQADIRQKIPATARRIERPAGQGSTHTKTRTASVQLASLAPEPERAKRPSHQSNLWVNGAGPRADWSTEEPVEDVKRATTDTNARFDVQKNNFSAFRSSRLPQTNRAYDAERVAYAPAFDEEHPDELSYRPFQILPLMTAKPVAQNKLLVAMVEPKYDRVHELLASSDNIPMQFRPSSRDALTLWNNQFKGKAILNIRQQTRNIKAPTTAHRMAQR